jgi:hypothetical protein
MIRVLKRLKEERDKPVEQRQREKLRRAEILALKRAKDRDDRKDEGEV